MTRWMEVSQHEGLVRVAIKNFDVNHVLLEPDEARRHAKRMLELADKATDDDA